MKDPDFGLQPARWVADNFSMSPLRRPATWALLLLAPTLFLLLPSCGSGRHATRELTERERDSVIARSSLPGAAVVSRALAVSDRMERRATKIESLGQ